MRADTEGWVGEMSRLGVCDVKLTKDKWRKKRECTHRFKQKLVHRSVISKAENTTTNFRVHEIWILPVGLDGAVQSLENCVRKRKWELSWSSEVTLLDQEWHPWHIPNASLWIVYVSLFILQYNFLHSENRSRASAPRVLCARAGQLLSTCP